MIPGKKKVTITTELKEKEKKKQGSKQQVTAWSCGTQPQHTNIRTEHTYLCRFDEEEEGVLLTKEMMVMKALV